MRLGIACLTPVLNNMPVGMLFMAADRMPNATMSQRIKKAGRPQAKTVDMELLVVELYEKGYRYRAIANIMNTGEYSINVHFSSVRKTLIRLGKVTGK